MADGADALFSALSHPCPPHFLKSPDFTAPNWQPLLDFLRTSAQPTSPRDVHASAAISQRSSLHHRPEVPSVASLRPGEVATCLAGLHCAPCLPLAWLQWGTALLQWAREASRPSGGAGSKGAGSVEHLEASSAGAHALCRYLGLAASQQEIGQPEDAMPCLVRILQVRVNGRQNVRWLTYLVTLTTIYLERERERDECQHDTQRLQPERTQLCCHASPAHTGGVQARPSARAPADQPLAAVSPSCVAGHHTTAVCAAASPSGGHFLFALCIVCNNLCHC